MGHNATMKELKVTGRILPISEATKRLNPHLYEMVDVATPTKGKRIRQSTKPLLNKLEQEWRTVLEQVYPDILITGNETKFRLANGLWYKPDFIVWGMDAVRCYEVKGPHAFRGGFENLKMAASKYPEFKWTLVWRDKETKEWKEQHVLP